MCGLYAIPSGSPRGALATRADVRCGPDRVAEVHVDHLLRARMCGAVAGFQAFGWDVSVDLGRAQVRVPEKLLHRTEVSATVKQVCRGRMAKRVWTIRSGSGQVSEQGCDKRVNRAGANPPTASTEKGGGLETRRRLRVYAGLARWARGETRSTPFAPPRFICCASEQDHSGLFEVSIKGTSGRCSVGNNPLLRPLANHPEGTAAAVDITDIESHNLRHPERGGIEQLDDRGIPNSGGIIRLRAGREACEEPRHRGGVHHPGQRALHTRRAQSGTGVSRCEATAEHPCRQPSRGCRTPSDSRGRHAPLTDFPQPIPKKF